MKILLTSDSYWPHRDGGAIFQRRLSHQLVDAGHEVSVWATNQSLERKFRVEQDGNVKIYREISTPWLLAKDEFHFAKQSIASKHSQEVFTDFKPDILHSHGFGPVGNAAISYAKKNGIPVIATNHLMPENALDNSKIPKTAHTAISPLLWRYIARKSNQVDFNIAPAQAAADFLVNNGMKKPYKVITNGVDVEYFKPQQIPKKILLKYNIDPEKPYILYLGRLDEEKRLDILVEAFSMSKMDFQLVIAGKGNSISTLQYMTQALNIEDKVNFTGMVDEEDKAAIFAAASLFVITSPAELQSIVCLEALACGTPVVAMDKAALRELCINDKTGRLIKWEDRKAFAKAIDELAKNPDKLEKYGEYARKMIIENHSKEFALEEHIKVYEQFFKK